MVLVYLPLAAVVVVLGALGLAGYHHQLDRALKRLGYLAFRGGRVEPDARRVRVLRAAGIGTPYRLYVTQTRLYASAAAFCGSIIGIYAGAFIIDFYNIQLRAPEGIDELFYGVPDVLRAFSVKFFLVLAVSSIVMGGLCAAGAYFIRWQFPGFRAATRERQINAGMPRMVAFIYALSRGGMAFPDVLRTLSRNRGVFGAGAEEVGVAVRNIDLFGEDQVSAISDLSRRTPSDQFQTFTENLVSVLRSGGDLSGFLQEEYQRFRQQAEDQQEDLLELLATVAEIYVTIVVAGTLFLITILFVIGLTAGDTLVIIRLITYLILPAMNVIFLAYLSEITRQLNVTREQGSEVTRDDDAGTPLSVVREGRRAAQADGGAHPDVGPPTTPDEVGAQPEARSLRTKANLDRLRAHRRLTRAREAVEEPVESLIDEPTLILWVTVPIAVLFLLVLSPTWFEGGTFLLHRFDDAIIQAVLFVFGTFAVVYEVNRRRVRQLEEAVPALLERLASLNEAGVAVVSSFNRVRQSDVGALDEEVERIWQDIKWGATVEDALDRFERRVETPAVTRIVTLLTNAMRASNEIGPVLRIAAEQARSDRRLRQQRRQMMLTYLIVVYIAFIVFLVVIGAIDTVLIPKLPDATATGGGATVPDFLRFGDVPVDAYRLVFFHAALIQATLSGLVGRKLGGGSLKDGVKHSAIMLAITYAFFLIAAEPFAV